MIRYFAPAAAVLAFALCIPACQTAPSETAAHEAEPPAPKTPQPPAYANADDAARLYTTLHFLPQPRIIEFGQGGYLLQDLTFVMRHDPAFPAEVTAAFNDTAAMLPSSAAPRPLPIDTRRSPDANFPAQGYALNIGPHGITITAADTPGAFYAAMTLKQLLRLALPAGVLPFVQITDHPDFVQRGVMLDISRDKVPTMNTLYSLVDQFAEWKFNELQLYTEHTFAYAGHEAVWANASPMTPDEVRALDDYCRARFIDLVPNQNSFGHMARWLTRPAYAHLAERPSVGYMLCPVDPNAVTFLAGLYDDLLPNFSSTMFNVGCDEAYAIGRGRSADAVKKRGVRRVYLDFLLQIHQLVQAHGKTMQFWGDIILQHPELIPELPKDVIALNWGYEASHPFASQTAKFAAAGIPFYVAPGTSSWNAIIGRTDNAVENLRNAAIHGRANGAIGYLITDWGDGGHWQFLPISYTGFAYGAALSWCVETNTDLNLRRTLDTHVFYDRAGVIGGIAYDLGNAYQKTQVLIDNRNAFNEILIADPHGPVRTKRIPNLKAAPLENALAYIERLLALLPQAQLQRTDANLVTAEFQTGAAMAAFACKLAIARLNAGDKGVRAIPPAIRAELAAEWSTILTNYEALWRARNREGGLNDSLAPLQRLHTALQN